MPEKRAGSSGGSSRGGGGKQGGGDSAGDAGGDDGGELRSSAQVRTALIDGATFRNRGVQYVVLDGLAMVEGDIVIGTEEEVAADTERRRAEKAAGVEMAVVISGSQFRWPSCRVPYTVDPALTAQNRVTDAIAHWEANTRFRFAVRTSEANFVTFRPSSGCSSSVGMRGGQQFINLGTGCTTGNTIHEIGHTVGLWHEQSREDRDSFVTIHWDKIISGTEHNFNQHITDGDDVGGYDYGSIMHYPRSAFSVDGSDTITPVDPAASIGQRTALSAGDIAAANSMCPAPKPIKETVKDTIVDTRKETIKDIRFDTRKELVVDTRKEAVFDPPVTRKEAAFDPPGGGKGVANDPPVVIPGGGVGPGLGRALPFAVAIPHRAPGAEAAPSADLAAAVVDLDAQLAALADQIIQADAARASLQAQYDELLAALEGAVQAHDS